MNSRKKGGISRNILNTGGRWNNSALDSKQDSIYWLGFYVLMIIPSLCIIPILDKNDNTQKK